MKKRETKSVSRNPFQDEATSNQSPRWSQNQAEPGREKIPANVLPHPLVDAKLADPPPGSEGAEGINGMPKSEFEDEPAD